VGETAFAVMREQFGEFLAHEPGTRLGEDPEELHDMRVASRRMRAAMSIFGEALPARAQGLKEELRWIAGVLGEVRDLDVQLEQLEGWISEAEPRDREHLVALRAVLEDRRARVRKAMLRTLDSKRYARMVDAFTTMLRRGPSRRSKAAGRPVLAVAPDIVRRRYRKVRKAGDGISDASSEEDYHELRKKGKRLRYTLEFLSAVYGKPARELVRPLKDLQDVLGDHQDAVVATEHLRELAEGGGGRGRRLPPGTVFVMGAISHRYALQARELRGAFPEAYAKIRGKRWSRLKKAMDGLRPAEEES
jgi:triphosphatase